MNTSTPYHIFAGTFSARNRRPSNECADGSTRCPFGAYLVPRAAINGAPFVVLLCRVAEYVGSQIYNSPFYEGGGAHSVQAKNRNRKVDHGPLFNISTDGCSVTKTPLLNTDEPKIQPLTEAELEADSLGSYNDCVRAIGEQYRAGRPLPASMLSRKARP